MLYSPVQALSRTSLEVYGSLVSVASFILDPIIENAKLLCDKLSYFSNIEAENIKLRLQLAKLAKLEIQTNNTLSENRELRKLLRVTEGAKYSYITSRLMGVNITPLSSSAIIEAGENNNIKINSLVTNHDGLVGRIVNVSDNYSSVMLLSDPSSRVPIITSSSREKGILAKQGDNIVLIYLPEEHNIEVGELVYTSGDGKVYPYGLLVGKVYKIDNNGVLVQLSADLNKTEFVTVESRIEQ